MISFRHVKKSFGDKTVLRDVSFDVQDGEVFFIIGQSGVGKSVLIKHLVGLLYPDGGEIWLDGEEISRFDEERMYPVRMKCAMVFQHSTLFDSMTCAENVALPLRKHKALSARDALAEARKRLTQVHMQEFGDRYPPELGDGMRKRVAIARALVTEPEIVFFDEPTTGLDPVLVNTIHHLILNLHRRARFTAVVVSHEIPEIFEIADTVAMLHEGRIVEVGPPAAIQGSTNPIVRRFIKGEPDNSEER
jgi:phospholipid/cholesterol/gamma-HCH transport system ATP-binding protein